MYSENAGFKALATKDPDISVIEKTQELVPHGNPQRRQWLFCGVPLTGWRVGTLMLSLASLVSLMLNVATAVWLAKHNTFEDGVAEVYRDTCSRVEKVNTGIHLVINVLSTVLLAGGNYCMQCLVAPSREMVDKAHRWSRWMDIGIPSFRNIGWVQPTHRIAWMVMALSSIPLHLMYNSAFYASLATHDYAISMMTEDVAQSTIRADAFASMWEHLDNAACMQAYAVDFVEDRTDVILITPNVTDRPNPVELYEFGIHINVELQVYEPYSWICSDPESNWKYHLGAKDGNGPPPCYQWINKLVAEPDTWTPWGYQVDYCLSKKIEKPCGLNASLGIIYTVIACNAIKCVIMLYVAFFLRHSPLIVLGDAIQSFLTRPDLTTRGVCLMSKADVLKSCSDYVRQHAYNPLDTTRRWRQLRSTFNSEQKPFPRRASAASRSRWFWTMLFFCLSIITGITFLIFGSMNQFKHDKSIQYFWRLGFGTVNGQALISGKKWIHLANYGRQVIASILVANIPQLVLSILYFNLNGLVTSVCLAVEWAGYSQQHKPLRVSTPKGNQRSSFFLTVPYRYAIPMLIGSALLHWLVSQSIFLAVVSQYDLAGNENKSSRIATCGYSPIAIVFCICLAIVVVIGTIGIGIPKLKAQIPLAGSCSAAISAACHTRAEERADIALQPVMWGAIPGWVNVHGSGHCAFSSQPVEEPQDDMRYY